MDWFQLRLHGCPAFLPGFCGSAVTYREQTKSAWLEIEPEFIQQYDVVSSEVATRMVRGVLDLTPEANVAASITGHLGPDAPPELDGVVYIATSLRPEPSVEVSKTVLTAKSRVDRQLEAADHVLQLLIKIVK